VRPQIVEAIQKNNNKESRNQMNKKPKKRIVAVKQRFVRVDGEVCGNTVASAAVANNKKKL